MRYTPIASIIMLQPYETAKHRTAALQRSLAGSWSGFARNLVSVAMFNKYNTAILDPSAQAWLDHLQAAVLVVTRLRYSTYTP
jgi:hypothetical protein